MSTIEEFRRSRAQFSYDELSERFKEEGGLPISREAFRSGYLYTVRNGSSAYTLVLIEDEHGFTYEWAHPCVLSEDTLEKAEQALYDCYVA